MHRFLRLLSLLLLIGFLCPAEAGLKIYYLRHAEGGHNVKKDWEERKVPKDKWPSYVGNPDVFTPKGKKQLEAATKTLKDYRFDFIATSPMWRARNTVLPYLKIIKGEAEIWPELHESSGSGEILAKKLPRISDKIFGAGRAIDLPEKEMPYFKFIKGGTHNFDRSADSDEEETAILKHALERAIDRIEKRFGDTDQSILLVGHGGSGKALMKILTDSESVGASRRSMENAEMWMVEKQADGSFELQMYNGEPFLAPVP